MNNSLVAQPKKTAGAGFSMITQEELPRRISINPQQERITTVIAARSSMRGDFCFNEGVKIDGNIDGSVIFGADDGMCIISKNATVAGSVAGPRALILGTIKGDLHVSGTLVLAPGSMVDGNVSYGRLVVYDGAQISGSLQMAGSREKPQAINYAAEGANFASEQPSFVDASVVPMQRFANS